MEYTLKWKREGMWFWRTEKKLIGHRWEQAFDKLVLYYHNGSVKEISNWTKCSASLGLDWVLATKKSMEKESGQQIQLAIEAK